MSIFRIVLGVIIFGIIDVMVIRDWHKNINAKTSWYYGIYVIFQTILWLSVVIKLELF